MLSLLCFLSPYSHALPFMSTWGFMFSPKTWLLLDLFFFSASYKSEEEMLSTPKLSHTYTLSEYM